MNLFKRIRGAISRYDDTHNYTCDNCGGELFDGRRLCAECRSKLPYNAGVVCPFCGRRVKEEGGCLECKRQPLLTDRARSLWLHEGDASKLVLHFKSGRRYLWRTFTEELLPLLEREFDDADGIVFVPMTKKALRKRGYNQSRLLSEGLSARTGKPLLDALEKTRETFDQRALSRREREENMKRCFRVTDKASVKGKRILIVDDTLTTGATTSAIAAVLKKAGASAVYALTVTSVEQKRPFGIFDPAEGVQSIET